MKKSYKNIKNKEFLTPVAMESLSPLGSLDAYVAKVQTFPMLSEEEEQNLAMRWRDQQDRQAAWRLVLSHLRYVVKLARNYRGYGLAESDLIQEGNIGLMKAVHRFDPSMGVRLVSFAVHWIKAEMHEFILKNFRLIKMATTKAQRKLFFNLNKMKKKSGFLSESERIEIAKTLDVPEKEVSAMENRLLSPDVSLEGTPDEADEDHFHPIQYLADQASDPHQLFADEEYQTHQESQLFAGIAALPEREREIVESRWLSAQKKTLQELAAAFQISIERVRQLEANAFKKLKKWVSEPELACS